MIESIIDIITLRIILAVVMLGIASYSDVKKREVSDLIWIVFGFFAVFLLFLGPEFNELVITTAISLIVAPFVLIVWRTGIFGGADAFAIIVLAVLVPQVTLSENVVTPFTILTNAVILSIIPMLVNFFRNITKLARKEDIFEGFAETKTKQILAIFIGYKAKNPKYGFSIEKKSGEGKKLNLSLQHAEYASFCKTPNTWITPGVPYMLFIAAGFIVQLLYGDIVFNFLG